VLPGVKDAADRLAKASGVEAVVGRPSTLYSHRRLQRNLPGIAAAVAAVEDRIDSDDPPPSDEPLFIFSAGWRSGSTLLQRLVVSADTHFIWGEPYHQTDIVRRLAESLIPFGTGWPPEQYVHEPGADGSAGADLSAQWIANFYPPVARLIGAHRAFLRELLAPPAPQADLRWGLKEVRLSAEYGLYLRMLFPRARFVFLVRDPRAAYRSYRERPTWFERWPRSQVRTPYAYGRLWRRLAESFLDHQETLGAIVVRYEDLVPGSDALDRLDQLLGAPVDRSVLDRSIAGAPKSDQSAPSALELRSLDRATQPLASELGYPSTERQPA
jgi:hypothetical protein